MRAMAIKAANHQTANSVEAETPEIHS